MFNVNKNVFVFKKKVTGLYRVDEITLSLSGIEIIILKEINNIHHYRFNHFDINCITKCIFLKYI